MSPHLSAKLLKPASPRLHDSDESDDDMVYSPYYRPAHHRCPSTSKPRRSHQLSPEVRAEIVARVLDPAYSGRREHSSRVFVDNNGDEHDPDFQLFPTQPVYPVRHRRTHTTSGFFRRVPSDDDLSQEDDGAESEAEWARVRSASPFSSSSSSAPSPPPNPVSLFGDDEWDEKEWTREVVVPVPQPKRRKHKDTPPTVYVPASPMIEPIPAPLEDEPEYESPARHSSVQLVREDTMDTDDTPSCGYVLRRQWATFALHTRLSAHRIARRARRAVSVGT